MGVLSDVVVADESQAAAIAAMDVPSAELPGADVKGIDTIKLALLESLLSGRSYDEIFPESDPIAEESNDGPWVFPVGRDLVSRLATATDQALDDTASKWAGAEEFQLEGWELSDVKSVLRELARVSALAVSQNKRLLLWMSL